MSSPRGRRRGASEVSMKLHGNRMFMKELAVQRHQAGHSNQRAAGLEILDSGCDCS